MSIDLRSAAASIFRECFEGIKPGADGTWFVQGREGIFDAVRTLTPEQASYRVEGSSSIGAHVVHLTYYLSLFNGGCRSESHEGDWDGSWKRQSLDAAEWKAVGEDVEREFAEAYAWYQSDKPIPSEEFATYSMANVAHAAYHLGAIRALLPIVTKLSPEP